MSWVIRKEQREANNNEITYCTADCVWSVTAHAQKPDFVFRAERTRPFKSARWGGVSSVDCWQPDVCASAVVMLDTPCSEVVWRVLATHCIRQFCLQFLSRASPCAITFQLQSATTHFCRLLLSISVCCKTDDSHCVRRCLLLICTCAIVTRLTLPPFSHFGGGGAADLIEFVV